MLQRLFDVNLEQLVVVGVILRGKNDRNCQCLTAHLQQNLECSVFRMIQPSAGFNLPMIKTVVSSHVIKHLLLPLLYYIYFPLLIQ